VLGLEYATIPQMIDILQRTYCSTIGVEFMHISDPVEKSWIQERIEGPDKGVAFTAEGKKAILSKLIEAEGFEQFIDVKYKGTKRFGLDGGESLIPALEQIVRKSFSAWLIVAASTCSASSCASRIARFSMNSRAAPIRRMTSKVPVT
jgi:2-oxoglutarate dehydrogenase E1 component